jgi:hypothetical protein
MIGVEPEVEVVAKAQRRRFTVEYKRKIVREGSVGGHVEAPHVRQSLG